MHFTSLSIIATVLATVACTTAFPLVERDNANVTPHDQYSSSVGVLGCKINTDRVAYWPGPVDCNNICVEVSYAGRSVKLLRVDQSGGAYDISYDAWNYLVSGQSARSHPVAGGGIAATYRSLGMDSCRDLLKEPSGKLGFSGANSMNFLTSCHNQPNSWVAKNYVIYNIFTPTCTYGYDEVCTLNWATQNQATCPHQLGATPRLTSQPVYNVLYPSGQVVVAP